MPSRFNRRSFLLAALSTLVPPHRAKAQERPSVDDFVDSVGVNVHLSSEPYSSRYDQFKELIGASRIRHLRDELRPDNELARWRELYDTHGIRSHLLVSPATNTVQQMLDYLSALGVDRVSAIEGQNEPNSDWFMAHPAAGADWATTTVAYQREVFSALRARYTQADLPILSPSIIDWKPGDVGRIVDARDFCEIVSIHSYVQHAQEPETNDDFAGLGWYVRHMADAFKPGASIMATEAGYSNVVGPWSKGISEVAAAKYIPRLLLNNFSAGIARTFLYEFMDGGRNPTETEDNWGMVRNDGAPKPAYHAVRSLLHALSDGGSAVPSSANTEVYATLQNPPPKTRSLTFGGRDGSTIMAIWRAVKSWNAARSADVVIPALPTALQLSRPVSSVTWMMPASGAEWTEMVARDTAITLPVRDQVMLVRLAP
jgi:hypothetical protein